MELVSNEFVELTNQEVEQIQGGSKLTYALGVIVGLYISFCMEYYG